MLQLSPKDVKFLEVLKSSKHALESVNVKFHLHAGTALGSHREKSFIPHDPDIDIGVFYKDVNTEEKIDEIKKSMFSNGFKLKHILGKLDNGFEISFTFKKHDINIDIFFIYEGVYRGKNLYILASYFGNCNNYDNKQCIWGYRPYKVQTINFLGDTYDVVPRKTLVDMYGKDWKIPKKFDYFEGIQSGGYKGLIRDYYNPRPTNNNIAFCFLLYDHVVHGKIWEQFFSSDNYPVKAYSIYTHLKTITDKTQNWVLKNKIQTIETAWCDKSLVYAWINMIKKALLDKNNKYFALLSGECIPLHTYDKTYEKITSVEKSRLGMYKDRKMGNIDKADQWMILNRKHAKMLVKLSTTEEGKNFVKNLKDILGEENEYGCPDEIYPILWFIHKYGKPSSESFKSEFKNEITTFTYWDYEKSMYPKHPVRFTSPKMEQMKKDICKSIFARKFNAKSARLLAMNC